MYLLCTQAELLLVAQLWWKNLSHFYAATRPTLDAVGRVAVKALGTVKCELS